MVLRRVLPATRCHPAISKITFCRRHPRRQTQTVLAQTAPRYDLTQTVIAEEITLHQREELPTQQIEEKPRAQKTLLRALLMIL